MKQLGADPRWLLQSVQITSSPSYNFGFKSVRRISTLARGCAWRKAKWAVQIRRRGFIIKPTRAGLPAGYPAARSSFVHRANGKYSFIIKILNVRSSCRWPSVPLCVMRSSTLARRTSLRNAHFIGAHWIICADVAVIWPCSGFEFHFEFKCRAAVIREDRESGSPQLMFLGEPS